MKKSSTSALAGQYKTDSRTHKERSFRSNVASQRVKLEHTECRQGGLCILASLNGQPARWVSRKRTLGPEVSIQNIHAHSCCHAGIYTQSNARHAQKSCVISGQSLRAWHADSRTRVRTARTAPVLCWWADVCGSHAVCTSAPAAARLGWSDGRCHTSSSCKDTRTHAHTHAHTHTVAHTHVSSCKGYARQSAALACASLFPSALQDIQGGDVCVCVCVCLCDTA